MGGELVKVARAIKYNDGETVNDIITPMFDPEKFRQQRQNKHRYKK